MTETKRNSKDGSFYPGVMNINKHDKDPIPGSPDRSMTTPAMCRHLKFFPRLYSWRYWVLLTVVIEVFFLILILYIVPTITRLNISPTDQVLIKLESTSIFCEKLSFYSASKMSVSNLLGDIKIYNKTKQFSWRKTRFVSVNNIWADEFRFLTKSDVRVTMKSDFMMKMCVVEDGVELPASHIKRCDPKQSDFCQTIHLIIEHPEEVKFISEVISSPTFADITYNFNRTRYAVNQAVTSCEDVRFCDVPLTFSAHSTIVVGSDVNAGEITHVKVQCQLRLLFLVPICNGILLVLIIVSVFFSVRDTKTSGGNRPSFLANASFKGNIYGTFALKKTDLNSCGADIHSTIVA